MATVYKVTTKDVDGVKHVAWASSDGAAKKARRELAEAHGLRPLKDVDIAQVDVPTSKGGIIDWLNVNLITEA